jgi:hypothetical protein
MSWLGRLVSGARFLGTRAAPMASYLGRALPGAMSVAGRGLATAGQLAANPLVGQLAQKIGVNPNVMRQVAGGISNAQAGLNLAPQVMQNVQNSVRSAAAAAAPAAQSLASLYRTVQGGR